MEQIIIVPLEAEYTTISIRTTNFESYNICPFKYKYEPPKRDSYLPFVFGKIVHMACQAFLIGRSQVEDTIKLRESILALLALQNPDGFVVKEATDKTPENRVTIQRIRTYMNLLDARYANEKFILSEFPVEVEIHYGKYKIIITGGLDLVTSGYSVVDLKTASSERKEELIRQKLQKIIYLYIMYKITKREDLRFEYAILRTDLKIEKNVKLQIVKTDLDIPAFEYVITELIKAFIYSEEHNVYPTKQCDSCRYCGLGPKGNKECPLFTNIEIKGSGESDY